MPSITRWKPPSFIQQPAVPLESDYLWQCAKRECKNHNKNWPFFKSILLFRVNLKFYMFIYCFFLDTFILCTVLNNNSWLLDAQSGGCISICEWRKENSLRFLSLMFYFQPHSWTQPLPNTSDTTSSASCYQDKCSR